MLKDKRFSRRALLKGASTSALGIPLLVGSSALGGAASTPPSERITLGFIGDPQADKMLSYSMRAPWRI